MDLGLKGKTALVAASSRGLGRAVADELGNEGANLVICARTAGPLEEAGQEIAEKTGTEVIAVPANLSEPKDTERLLKTAKAAFGDIDILITNTGGPPPGPFESHSSEAWSDAVHQNLYSVLRLTRAVLPEMKQAGWGRIVNITSVAVKQPVDGLILSNSVRAAVTGFAKTLSNEVAGFGVTVNNVMPGYTKTERLDQLAADIAGRSGTSIDETVAQWESQIPMGRIGSPREFAAMVAFLASERASYITGVSVQVDGGSIRSLF
ncbi:MAG: SDR family oxidoreductase [Gemmatimonadota bacterium]|nr:SDR family oxidoreductase [Gemmatimonadota bacterium]